ncbi:MAG: hypothetical protein LBQ81_14140 [Zoogloeaceae bacterium]|jgi:hypothetical protein|nr:hypothetical protein [Zoogloeaceae bacterium]
MPCLLLGNLLCASAYAANELQPTQVLDLYLKVLINRDIRSATEINDYMRPLTGQNVFNLQGILDMEDLNAAASPQQTESERLFLKTLLAAAQRSSCQSTASELERDAATGNRIASVEYVCFIPDAHVSTALKAFENAAASDAAKAAILSGIITKLEAAPIEKEIVGILQLQEVKAGGKSYWRPVAIGNTLSLVLGNLISE